MILGRPRTIHPDDCDVQEPIECEIPENSSTCVPGTRQHVVERDRPNSVSNNLFLYRLSNVWHAVKAMKADRPSLTDSSVVQQVHDQVNRIMDRLPPTLRHEHPDLSWDEQYPYLRQQREDIVTKANLILMALHRPHLECLIESRRAALQAALVILDSQHRSFMIARPHQYKLFGLSFYTIDASLLLAVVAARYLPQRDSEVILKIHCVLHQAMNRLSAMHSYSPIARAGLTILRQCYQVLQKRLGCNTTTLNLPKAPATELGNAGLEFEIDVVQDSLSEQRPHLSHQAYQQHNQQTSGWGAPTSLPTGCSASSFPTLGEPNSPQSGWTLNASADASFMPTTAVQPSLALDPSTTDFDEVYWLSIINETAYLTNINAVEAVEADGILDTAAMEYNTFWNQIQFCESST